MAGARSSGQPDAAMRGIVMVPPGVSYMPRDHAISVLDRSSRPMPFVGRH
jgi:hypothetical protein